MNEAPVMREARLRDERDRARDKVEDLQLKIDELHTRATLREREMSDLSQRNRGMQGRLVRIRKKADLATGITSDTDRDDRDLAGRAGGAEGAVDLLIAKCAGTAAKALALALGVDDE